MTPDELKLMIREDYPNVWKTTKPWLIKSTSAIKIGEGIRDKLVKAGFRQIDLTENISKSLTEAETYLIGKFVDREI